MAMGLSRDDWTAAALDALAEVGLSAVAIDPLARRLGATKGSFYWHFSSRDELIAATLELWERRDTIDLVASLEAIEDPQERLVALARSAYGTAARGTDPQAGVLAAASPDRSAMKVMRASAPELLEALSSKESDLSLARPHRALATLERAVTQYVHNARLAPAA